MPKNDIQRLALKAYLNTKIRSELIKVAEKGKDIENPQQIWTDITMIILKDFNEVANEIIKEVLEEIGVASEKENKNATS